MTGNLVVIGENPHRESVAHRPSLSLTGSSGRNLASIAGWDWMCYLRHVDRTNLFFDPQPRWDAGAARMRAAQLELGLAGRSVILCGQKVAAAFGVADEPLFRWLPTASDVMNIAKIPHPSGSCRLWNLPEVRAEARAFLGGLVHCE